MTSARCHGERARGVDPEVVDGDNAADGEGESLCLRLAVLEGNGRDPGDMEAVNAGDEHGVIRIKASSGTGGRHGAGRNAQCRGLTLEQQPDEDHAFGLAAPLVAEWRELLAGSGHGGSRVDRAGTAVRRWKLEALMLGEFNLTLLPETHPLDDARLSDHVRWRRKALEEARRELVRAELVRLVRLIFTVCLWWK